MKFATLEEKSTYWSNAENALTSKTRSLSLEHKGKKNGLSVYKVLTSTSLPEFVSGEVIIDNLNKTISSKIYRIFLTKTFLETE